jgi:2-polyprenyl-3-methyl-5-hydroxy-6-metoxy-1,4-benzoquinol methylase
MSAGPRCPCCGNDALDDLGRNQDFPASRVWFCPTCRSAATHPAPGRAALDAFYRVDYSESNRSRCRHFSLYDVRAAAQVETILRSGLFDERDGRDPLAGLDVLDIGCGPGSLLREFQRRGAWVLGYDADPAVVAAARSRLGTDADVRCRPFDPDEHEPHSFDVVALSHVLEHIAQPDEFLSKLLRLLRGGGCLFVEVPNYDLRRTRQFLHRACRGSGHVNFFSRHSLVRLMGACGGRIVLVETAGPAQALTEVPYGRARTLPHRIVLGLEREFGRRLAALGLRRAPLEPAPDWPTLRQPPHVEGLYLRGIATPRAPAGRDPDPARIREGHDGNGRQ